VGHIRGPRWPAGTAQAEAARAKVVNIVNSFLRNKLTGHPAIRVYIDHLQQA
jgi:hypothetical protein